MASKNRIKTFFRLFQASRGVRVINASKTNGKLPLPYFPVEYQHIATTNHNPSPSSGIEGKRRSRCKDDHQRLYLTCPNDFHSYLCTSISKAKTRVHLATLYIGTGAGYYSESHKCKSIIETTSPASANPKEMELLDAISKISYDVDVKILMDESRGQRPVNFDIQHDTGGPTNKRITCSANEVYNALNFLQSSHSAVNGTIESECSVDRGIYLFPVTNKNSRIWLQDMLPSTWNELLGVFHLKVR